MNLPKRLFDNILSHPVISGVGEGEKCLLCGQFDHAVLLCADFVSAGKLKRGLEALGKTCQIVTSSREGKDGEDKNLLAYVGAISAYMSGTLNYVIFLPCSAMIKFDLDIFLNPFKFEEGKDYPLEQVAKALTMLGYERQSLVGEGGQFALRGDILDIFPANTEKPVRIEFFGDTVDKISIFDAQTMKNEKKINYFSLFPNILPVGQDNIFTHGGVNIVDEPKRVQDEFELLLSSYKVTSTFDASSYVDAGTLFDKADYIFDNRGGGYENDTLGKRTYLTDFLALKSDAQTFLKMKQSVIVFAGNEKNKEKLGQFCYENGLIWHDFEHEDFEYEKIFISQSEFPYSFSFLKERVVGIGADNLFKQTVSKFAKGKHAVFYLPKLGEYVVHSFHGIGKCIKIERLKIGDYEKDYFVIEYKNGGVLYLPSEQADTLSAYVGSEQEPKLSSLGGGEFARLKNRVKASLKEMAFSLAEIYKERQNSKGFAFKRDEFLEKQFADAFPFTPTEDQLKAINDVDKDMESDKIMDRLICGDVGFGKTEVALRACFKCCYNGKQVCLLCPTTILSEQHYRTAKARLEPFGVKVEVLNRFKTLAQAEDIKKKLQEGKIDMIVGTHKLLGKDVFFKDLGLFVLDEEQRFGVEDKEKIKNAKRDVDVLSLSATPIPRTLNMSLSGIRDISLIETPPRDRLPIQTYVAESSDELFKDVLKRELSRKGQAFVIYNRVEDIFEFAGYIGSLVPEARIGIAHGQMPERQLESVIQKLYDKEYDIFISTTLIENGVDLPSANTMIIVDADRLGLGQLYQIRGRIGRSDRLSYAYLTYTKDKILTPEAYKRLEAIKEFSHLGSGFKIAMRDLEIRGAGDIFGKQQHGHIAKVGYDMFVKLLDEAVKELQGKKTEEEREVKLEIALDAFIGEDFIPSSDERIVFYTRISEIKSEKDMKGVLQSMEDGFGFVPNETKNLCLLAYLKNLAGQFGVTRIVANAVKCDLYLEKREDIIDPRLGGVIADFNGKISFESLAKVSFDKVLSVREKVEMLINLFEKAEGKVEN